MIIISYNIIMSLFGKIHDCKITSIEEITDNINYNETVFNVPHIGSFMDLCYKKKRVSSPYDYIHSKHGFIIICHH